MHAAYQFILHLTSKKAHLQTTTLKYKTNIANYC